MTCPTLPIRALPRVIVYTSRRIHSGPPASSNDKYAERLRQKAKEKGLDLEDLKSQAHKEALRKQKEEAVSLLASLKKPDAELPHVKLRSNLLEGARAFNGRRDSSPVKPLSSILNISKITATPHTPSQISALWTAYHASRTNGTGRGYICASLPAESYNVMLRVAKRYPVFVIPVPRESNSDISACGSVDAAQEFFFLQWDSHPAPFAPSVVERIPFEASTSSSPCQVSEPSTVLFTPLQEYKLRTSFATPYLVITFYTDLSQSHGIVLLRGEITPSPTPAAAQPLQETPERFLLGQVDAQLLAMGLQRFYLWEGGRKQGGHDPTAEALLKQFHEEPEKFNWQDILKFSDHIA